MDDICSWTHDIRIDPNSTTAKRGVSASAFGCAMLALAFSDEPVKAHADFWIRLQAHLQNPEFAAAFEQAKAEIQS